MTWSEQKSRAQTRWTWLEIFLTSLRLGCTSFGGPVAHLGYFRQEYVQRKRWLDDKAYADIVALCQALPGPASSQVGIAIGMLRGGFPGAVASWMGFTLPSALALMVGARFMVNADVAGSGWLRGLMIAAVVVVAHAIWGMARTLTPDRIRQSIAMAAAVIALLVPTATVQLWLIVAGGIAGWLIFRKEQNSEHVGPPIHLNRKAALVSWITFFGLLFGLPFLRIVYPVMEVRVFDSFFRVGSLVFGGGHVVLPLLASEVVGSGWLPEEGFLAGYGIAQAVPGPLFTFAAYLGVAMDGWFLGLIALVAIFFPSFLMVTGALPFWDVFRRAQVIQAALRGVNAVVVGILIAALYDPVWTKGMQSTADVSLGLITFALLMIWNLPAWSVVLISALGGTLLHLLA